ncbi:hypothetical protein [Streptomyces sp. NPDC002685]|uniref:hypothetical protein n=1 Tax=Streptomyces sp. NPDC002685 TaxID=3154540 RepID=UPI003321014B
MNIRGAVQVEHGVPSRTFSPTARPYTDRPAIEVSVRDRLLGLPGGTLVRTGDGADTTDAAERPDVPAT